MIPCGLVLRSVGYRGVALPGVPFDDERGVDPEPRRPRHRRAGEPIAGLYCAGWIKRGPSGVIGTNKKDAAETVERLLADARAGLLPRGDGDLEELLSERGALVRRLRRLGGDRRGRARPRRAARPAAGQARQLGRAARARQETVAPARRLSGTDHAVLGAGCAFARAAARVIPMSEQLWGGETAKAIENFPVSGEPIPAPVARWLGRIKAAAARVNAELGLLDPDKAERIAAAGDRIANGELDDQFPIDVFQTGSGTSSNMNANEVIAALAGEDVHPNDDVNLGQSSNDVFPSAVHLAALGEIVGDLLPALDRLAGALQAKAEEFDDVVKSGRTHWMDAVPVTLGQEFGGYAAQVREGAAGSRHARAAREDPARRHRRRHRSEHASRVRRARAREARGRDGPRDQPAGRPVRVAGRARRARRGLRCAEDGRRLADEDRERPALPRLRPARRPRRDLPAGAAEGLVDHAGQGQPGHPRGRHAGRRPGDRQRRRDHDRRHAGPFRAERLRPDDRAQPARLDPPARLGRAAAGREVRRAGSRRTASSASATPS